MMLHIPPKHTWAFQLPFKLCASRTSTREARDNKDNNINEGKKQRKEDDIFMPNALEIDNHLACPVAALFLFFQDKDFKGGHPGRSVQGMRQIAPGAIVRHVAQYTAETASGEVEHHITHNPRPSGSPTFSLRRRSNFLAEHVLHRHPYGQVPPGPLGLQRRASPTAEEMKSHITFYHVLILQPKACNKPNIPADGLGHAPAVTMINHLIWFMESAVDEDQDEQCH
jgi:hypothetical protein